MANQDKPRSNILEDSDSKLKTEKYCSNSIVNGIKQPFLIPIYQRLYTWEESHVKRLMDDLWQASEKKSKEDYFIGSLVTIEDDKGKALEVIDGQQRLTTLWLIASALVVNEHITESSKKEWWRFLSIDGKPRLSFLGRTADIESFQEFIDKCSATEITNYRDPKSGWMKNTAMIVARKTIFDFLSQVEKEQGKAKLQKFSDFIWGKTSFVITKLHPSTERERFFDTMNSRGMQLEKHEILKALMLHELNKDELYAYGKAWDLCADIHNYAPKETQEYFNYGQQEIKSKLESFFKPESSDPEIPNTENSENDRGRSLKNIIKDIHPKKPTKDKKVDKNVAYKSPVSFPVFLLHVLKLKLDGGEDISLDDKNLIDTFKPHIKKDKQWRKSFIKLLLEYRLLLDNFVIKGRVEENDNYANWGISSHLADTDKKSRRSFTGKEWASIKMLQCMMHFSPMSGGHRATWLNAVLKQLHYSRNDIVKEPIVFLNALRIQDQKYAAGLLEKQVEKSLEHALGAGSAKGLGTGVHHYWFYKLEFCLWELWNPYVESPVKDQLMSEKPDVLNRLRILKEDESKFRMRAVSSIEHVSPQSGNNGVIGGGFLDRFGNLALLSVSENSSNSDKDPLEKKASFVTKRDKGFIESLKLAHIFDSIGSSINDWDDDALKAHEDHMLAVLKAYQNMTFGE